MATARERPVPLLGPGGFQEQNPALLASVQSARYLLQEHRTALVAAGAVVLLGGKWCVFPSKFERELIRIGHLAARGKVIDYAAKEVLMRKRMVDSLAKMLREEKSALRTAQAAAKASPHAAEQAQ